MKYNALGAHKMTGSVNLFSSKIKILRTIYGLSLAELSEMLFIKSTSLYAWENQTSSPSLENIIALANLFGISLDWLVGRSQMIYTTESIVAGEVSLSKQFKQGSVVGKDMSTAYLQEIQQLSSGRYVDIMTNFESWLESRNISYSKSVRANLLVLFHFVTLWDFYWAEEYLQNDKKKRGVLVKAKARIASIVPTQAENYKEPGKKAKERAVNLVKLLQPLSANSSLSPIYDVEAAYNELLANSEQEAE